MTLLEANTLGWGASTRNGGIVHAGYKWGPTALLKRYGEVDRPGALPRDARVVRARQAAHRRRGHRLRLPRGRASRAGLRTVARPRARARPRQPGLGRRDIDGHPARPHPRGDRHRRLLRGAGRRGERAAPPGPLLRRARRGRRPGRRGPARGRSGDGRSGGRATGGSSSRPSAARSWRATCSSRPTATPTASSPTLRRRVIPIGSYIIASEPLPADLAHELSPKGRSFFDTKNFLYYWHVSADRRMIFGGRASFLPTNIDRSAAILHKGLLEVHPQLGGLPDRVRLGRERRLHVRPDAARRADQGRRRVRARLLRDGRRADDPARDDGRGVAGRRRGPGPDDAQVPARAGPVRGPAVVPAGRRGVVPAPGSAGPSIAPVARPRTDMPKPLAVQLYTFRDPARFGGAGMGLDPETLDGDRRDRVPRRRDRRRARRRPGRRPTGARRRPVSRSRARTPGRGSTTSTASSVRPRASRRSVAARSSCRARGFESVEAVEAFADRLNAAAACRGPPRPDASAITTTSPRCAPLDGIPVVSAARRARSIPAVVFQLDIFWVVVGGAVATEVHRRARRSRIVSLHVKDGDDAAGAAAERRAVRQRAGRRRRRRHRVGDRGGRGATPGIEWLIVEFDHVAGSPDRGGPAELREPDGARPRPGTSHVTATRPARVGIVGCGDVTGLYLPGTRGVPGHRARGLRGPRRGAGRGAVGPGRLPGRADRRAARRPVDRDRAQPDAADGPRRR